MQQKGTQEYIPKPSEDKKIDFFNPPRNRKKGNSRESGANHTK